MQSLLIPRTVCSKTSKPELCFVNVTDKNIILHSGQDIATVEEAQVLGAETESNIPKTRVSKKTDTIPKHTEELLRDRPFNLKGGGMVFCFVQKFFFRRHKR